jgi:hypothetical protein
LLHAHIILWIEDGDVEQILNEITVVVSAAYDDEKEEFIEPTNDIQRKLFKMVLRKQLYTCDK